MKKENESGNGGVEEIADDVINKNGSMNVVNEQCDDEVVLSNDPNLGYLLGTVVHNETEAYALYCDYAHQTGFSVRKDHTSYWPNSKKLKSRDFLCAKAGRKKPVNLNHITKFKKTDTRSGCSAMIRFCVDLEGNWSVKKYIESHNHSLAKTGDLHLLRSHRCVTDEKASVLKTMTEAGISATDAFSYLAEEVGGVENIGFTKRDAFNFIQKERRSRIASGDSNELIQLFKERQAAGEMFAWDVQVDASDCLVSFFWSNGMSRVEFDCFGDVIIFDTSYRLNKYNLVCAPLVGVNHHWQNVLFGVAFLSEETIESFTWLFRTFLRLMGGRHPITIFTDQDQAMARAIENVLPHTRHRLCQWHISKKAPSKVHCFSSNKRVQGLFYACMSKCDTEDEFEDAWSAMLEEGNLYDHAWLSELYKIRQKWSTAFNKDKFCIDILSTQRSEATNSVCHGISKPTSSLTDCFLGLEKVMETWRRNEHDEDFKCIQSAIVPVVRSSPILKQAALFYTRKLYSMFEEEFLHGVGGLSVTASDDRPMEYLVRNLEKKNASKTWIVHFDVSTMDISCSCQKFEMMGILCAHCIRVLSQNDVLRIPDKYLLMRWSTRAKRDIYIDDSYRRLVNMESRDGTGIVFRNHISRYAYQISSRAQGNKIAEDYMLASLKRLSDEVDSVISGNSPPFDRSVKRKKATTSSAKDKDSLKDPIKRRPKGVSNARLKAYWEKSKKSTKTKVKSESAVERDVSPVAAPLSVMPQCFSQEFNSTSSINQHDEGYTKLMMDIITRRHFDA